MRGRSATAGTSLGLPVCRRETTVCEKPPTTFMSMNDEVCEDCGSDPIYAQIETTSITSNARSFEKYPERCSNPSCPNFHGGGMTGFTIPRSEWDATHEG